MKRFTLALCLALGAAAAPLSSMAAPRVDVFVGAAPPAPLVERIPPPRHGYVWAPGHWEWNGRRHIWVRGYWIAERPGYAYSAPVWVQRGGGWYLEPERWTPYRGYEHRRLYGERERYEHERYEHERHHDRDGDGVPNRYDNHPDNPYRR